MVAAATADELGKAVWDSLGYLPLERESESVSKTLEYAFDDACIARMAEDLGRKTSPSGSGEGLRDGKTFSIPTMASSSPGMAQLGGKDSIRRR